MVSTGIQDVIPAFGAVTAGGTLGAALVKSTAALPPTQRMVYGVGGTLLGTVAAKVGLEAGAAITKNLDLSKSIKGSQHSNTDPDQIPSPEETNFSINSPLDEGDIPLLGLINSIFSLNVIELIIIIFIFFIYNNEKN